MSHANVFQATVLSNFYFVLDMRTRSPPSSGSEEERVGGDLKLRTRQRWLQSMAGFQLTSTRAIRWPERMSGLARTFAPVSYTHLTLPTILLV
eukprot:2692617-Amphidinium_carterae.1